jgi:hypothetical protein
MQGHYQFFQRCISSSFSNAVDRAFQLPRSTFDGF